MNSSVSVGGATKSIIDSIVASGLPPEQVVARLDSYGIDWYVTEKGDLMIRYWQIGAEDFVPIERVGTIRENQAVPREANPLEWLSSRLSEIKGRYGNRWIAIVDHCVIADADNLPNLLQKIQETQIQNPFVTFIPGEPVVWNTAYGNENI